MIFIVVGEGVGHTANRARGLVAVGVIAIAVAKRRGHRVLVRGIAIGVAVARVAGDVAEGVIRIGVVVGAGAGGAVLYLPLMAAFGVLRLVISGLTGMLILYAVLSWVQTSSPLSDVLDRLCAPLLRPIRRRIPMVGGVDLSPMALILLIYVLQELLQQGVASLMPRLFL